MLCSLLKISIPILPGRNSILKCFKVLGLLFVLAVCLQAATATKGDPVREALGWHTELLKNAVVVVVGDKITSVTVNGKIPPGAEKIDLESYTAIPGMIDMHTHVTYYWDGDSNVDARRQKRKREGVMVALAQRNGMKALEAGVTTLRDLNAANGADIDLRDLINMGVFVGPHLFVSGGGMHGLPKIPDMKDKVGQTTSSSRKQRLAEGVDWIKVFGSTGGFDNVTGDQTVSYEEMKAIVDTAHAAGVKVAIHSYGPSGARDAIKAGCDTLEHATDMDDETIAELVRKKIWYVPTIDHNEYYVEHAATTYKFPAGAVDNLKDYIQQEFHYGSEERLKLERNCLWVQTPFYNGFGLRYARDDVVPARWA